MDGCVWNLSRKNKCLDTPWVKSCEMMMMKELKKDNESYFQGERNQHDMVTLKPSVTRNSDDRTTNISFIGQLANDRSYVLLGRGINLGRPLREKPKNDLEGKKKKKKRTCNTKTGSLECVCDFPEGLGGSEWGGATANHAEEAEERRTNGVGGVLGFLPGLHNLLEFLIAPANI